MLGNKASNSQSASHSNSGSRVGVLGHLQTQRLQKALCSLISLRGGSFISSQWPQIHLKPLVYAFQITDALAACGVQVQDVRVQGNIVRHCFDAGAALTDICLLFKLPVVDRDALYTSREVVLDCLAAYLPKALASKDRHMIAAAYIQRMMVTATQQNPTDEAYSMFSLPGTNGSPTVHCKFVQVIETPKVLDADAVQIILRRDLLEKNFTAAATTTTATTASATATAAAAASPATLIHFETLFGSPVDAVRMLSAPPSPANAKKPARKVLSTISNASSAAASQRGSMAAGSPSTASAKMTEATKQMLAGCAAFADCTCWLPTQPPPVLAARASTASARGASSNSLSVPTPNKGQKRVSIVIDHQPLKIIGPTSSRSSMSSGYASAPSSARQSEDECWRYTDEEEGGTKKKVDPSLPPISQPEQPLQPKQASDAEPPVSAFVIPA